MARLTDKAGKGPIDLGKVASDAGLHARLTAGQIEGGFSLARWVLALIGFVLALIAAYAWLTYPDEAMVREFATTPADRLRAYENMRQDWFSSIKDLLQLMVVSLLIPLLATLVGYIFGRQTGSAPDSV